jgi:ketosteroid isomerase-like protein
MDERRRELLGTGYGALSRGDIEGALSVLDPEVEIVTSGAFLDQGMVYRGHDGAREFFEMIGEVFEELSYDVLEVHEVDEDRVLVIVRLHGRGKGTGLELDREAGHLWTLRGETPIRMQGFADPDAARAAAGLV